MDWPGEGLGLPKGMKEEAFVAAVEASGYPLQIVVGAALAERGYLLEEEWAFADPETEERRTLDVVATLTFPKDSLETPRGSIEPGQTLLIECKQSILPFVFFESVAPPKLTYHPAFLGLETELIAPPGSLSHRGEPVTSFLGLENDPLIRTPRLAASLTRAEAKGSDKVLISGDHAFNSLLLPLTKAFSRYRREHRGRWPDRFSGTNSQYHTRITMPLAVVDAPMIFVARPAGEPEIEATNWVRLVVRHPVTWHRLERGTMQGGGGFTVVDVIHRSFLESFLGDYWTPFGEQFFSRFSSRAEEVFREED